MEQIVMQLVQAVAASLMPPTGNVQRNVAGYVVVAIFCATAYIALVFCGWFAINQAYGPVAASALVAAVAVVLALAAWAIVGVLNARSKRRAAEAKRRAEEEMKRHAALHETLAGSLAGPALAALPGMIGRQPIATLIGVAALTYAIAKPAGRNSRANGR